jgi:hypothetical protein
VRWWTAVRAAFAAEPRFWLPVAFLLVSVALLIVALTSLDDSGAAFGWGGFSAGFLTAGLVDLFGLIESRRMRLRDHRNLAPVRQVIAQRLQLQQRDLVETVTVLFDLQGGPEEWLPTLRDPAREMFPREPAEVFPPQNRGDRAADLLRQAKERQAHLEALSAGGLLTREVAAVSQVVNDGVWSRTVGALYAVPSAALAGAGPAAADAVEAVLAVRITNR